MNPTALTIRQCRADLLADWARRNTEIVRTIADLRRLPHVQAWSPAILDQGIDDNVATGRFTEDAYGHLVINDPKDGRR